MFSRYIHLSLVLSLGYFCLSTALPLDARQKQKNTKGATKATDGSTIIDKQVVIKYGFAFTTRKSLLLTWG